MTIRVVPLVSFFLLLGFLPALLLGCGPFLTLPGGSLDGEVASAPDDWAFTDEISTIQLETNPADPYSVNIWAVGMGDSLYVHAGTNRAAWVENLEADPSARVRIEGTIYVVSAARVESQADFDAFAGAYEAKYDRRPSNENVTEAYVFGMKSP